MGGIPNAPTSAGVCNKLCIAFLQAVNPGQVRGYLQRAFKEQLSAVQSAMQQLANAYSPEEVGKRGYDLYVDFR